jgi:hypothetical protein
MIVAVYALVDLNPAIKANLASFPPYELLICVAIPLCAFVGIATRRLTESWPRSISLTVLLMALGLTSAVVISVAPLLDKPLNDFRLVLVLVEQHLDCQIATQVGVTSLENCPHPAASDLAIKSIAAFGILLGHL